MIRNEKFLFILTKISFRNSDLLNRKQKIIRKKEKFRFEENDWKGINNCEAIKFMKYLIIKQRIYIRGCLIFPLAPWWSKLGLF